jgi:hypothetical protein
MTEWIWLKCSLCQKQISSPVPPATQVRAWIECYDCHKSDVRIDSLRNLILAIYDAAAESNWCSESLADALLAAELQLPKHRRES